MAEAKKNDTGNRGAFLRAGAEDPSSDNVWVRIFNDKISSVDALFGTLQLRVDHGRKLTNDQFQTVLSRMQEVYESYVTLSSGKSEGSISAGQLQAAIEEVDRVSERAVSMGVRKEKLASLHRVAEKGAYSPSQLTV